MDDATATPSRRTAPRAQRRQELIAATMDVIAERGLAGTTLAEVTGRAGLSLGLVSHHFASKDNLLTATLRHLAEELRALWAEPQSDARLSSADKLRAIVEGMFDPRVCTPTKIAVWFAFFGDAHYRGVYRAMVEQFDSERGDVICQLCEALVLQGGYDGVDPLALTQSIEALADGLWLGLMLYPDWFTPAVAAARVVDLLALNFPRHFARSAGAVPQRAG